MASTWSEWFNLSSSVPTVSLNLREALLYVLQILQSIAIWASDWRVALSMVAPLARRNSPSIAPIDGWPNVR